MPNFSKTLNGKGFPFDYNPGNPHYIPINVTTAPNGALFQKNGSSSFTDAYYYYEFIDTRLPTLKARLIFLKAILSSTNYGTHNGETPIWFKVMSPPQDPLSAGFEINYQTKSITLPDTMVINPVALAKDFLAQFPELRQNYGAVLQASTSNPAIKNYFQTIMWKNWLSPKTL